MGNNSTEEARSSPGRRERTPEKDEWLNTVSERLRAAYNQSRYKSYTALGTALRNAGWQIATNSLPKYFNARQPLRNFPSIYVLAAFCDVFGMSADYFLTGIDPAKEQGEKLTKLVEKMLGLEPNSLKLQG